MPKIFRSMKADADKKPVIEASNKGLGVRFAPVSIVADVDLDQAGKVILNGKGMSVAPNWRDLPPHLVPRRLKDRFPDAIGSVQLHCFSMGNGPFQDGPIADDLKLLRDSPRHGIVVPLTLVSVEQFQVSLAATREFWSIEED